DFKDFARTEPSKAFEIGWKKATIMPDCDDGALISDVLEIINADNHQELFKRLLQEWTTVDSQHRRAIISAARYRHVFSVPEWLQLFDHPSSTTGDKHLLLVMLASGDKWKAFKEFADKYIPRTGIYGDEWRDKTLRQTIQWLNEIYG